MQHQETNNIPSLRDSGVCEPDDVNTEKYDMHFCMVFHVRWIFLTTSLRIPPELRSDEGGIRRRVVRNPSHMENHTK